MKGTQCFQHCKNSVFRETYSEVRLNISVVIKIGSNKNTKKNGFFFGFKKTSKNGQFFDQIFINFNAVFPGISCLKTQEKPVFYQFWSKMAKKWANF